MKKPAESREGTTATVRFGFSTLGFPAAPPPPEHPAASTSVAAVTSSAVPRTRLVLISLTLPRGRGGQLTGGACPGPAGARTGRRQRLDGAGKLGDLRYGEGGAAQLRPGRRGAGRADPAWLGGLISRRVPLSSWQQVLTRQPGDVKVAVDLTK